MLPLTKTMDLKADLPLLAKELEIVDKHFGSEQGQSQERRWEYAMALEAIKVWDRREERGLLSVLDVGGAGSPLQHIVPDLLSNELRATHSYRVADPACGTEPVEFFAKLGAKFDVVLCISVLEHVEDLASFVADLAAVVAPGGMLFLTMDIKEEEGPDDRHFHWMRERIFTPKSWHALRVVLGARGFEGLGYSCWDYNGDQLYGPKGYSFASLALTRK